MFSHLLQVMPVITAVGSWHWARNHARATENVPRWWHRKAPDIWERREQVVMLEP